MQVGDCWFAFDNAVFVIVVHIFVGAVVDVGTVADVVVAIV